MNIVLGTDHRGTGPAKILLDHLRSAGHEVNLLSDCDASTCDYPEPAFTVGRAVNEGRAQRGILLCGSGIGMSIAANKVPGVRAALVHDELTAQMSRGHNDANVLCMSADLLGQRLIEKIVDIWLATEFEGGRHARRVHKIAAIERGEDPSSITS